MVDVNGDTDLTSLWTNARDYLDRRYGRLKLLKELHQGPPIPCSSYEELASLLDQKYEEKSLAKKFRTRPSFEPLILQTFSNTWGGTRHRRHIVMSSTMREAVYAVSDNNKEQDVLNAYNKLISLVSFGKQDTLTAAETQLVKLLHNNPVNLVLDNGPWNTAIGMLATKVRQTLSQDPNQNWQKYKADPEAFLQSQVGGFQSSLQSNIMAFWIDYAKKNPPQDGDDLQELLISIQDNAAFDILSQESLLKSLYSKNADKKKTLENLMKSYALFEQAQADKSLPLLQQACELFIGVGVNDSPVSYASFFQ
jgi:hypothetical protein